MKGLPAKLALALSSVTVLGCVALPNPSPSGRLDFRAKARPRR